MLVDCVCSRFAGRRVYRSARFCFRLVKCVSVSVSSGGLRRGDSLDAVDVARCELLGPSEKGLEVLLAALWPEGRRRVPRNESKPDSGGDRTAFMHAAQQADWLIGRGRPKRRAAWGILGRSGASLLQEASGAASWPKPAGRGQSNPASTEARARPRRRPPVQGKAQACE